MFFRTLKWRKASLLTSAASCMLTLTAAFPAFGDTLAPDRSDAPVASIFENKGSYRLLSGDRDLGEIDIYVGDTGALIPLDTLLSKLGYSFYRDDANQRVQITFADQSTLTLNFDKNQYMRQGVIRDLDSTDYLVMGPYIFLNTAFMNRVFPIGFSLDQAARKLRVENANLPAQAEQPTTPNAPLYTPMPDAGILISAPPTATSAQDDFPVPMAAPRMPVIVDDVTQREAPQSTPLPENQDVIHATAPVETQMTPIPSPGMPLAPPPVENNEAITNAEDENNLILQPKIKQLPPSDVFIEALELNNTVYLPLKDMSALLEFDIKCDPANKTAEGTFMSPPRAFSLNMTSMEVAIDHHAIPLLKGEVIVKNNQIYASLDAFQKWFGVTSEVVRQSMTLKLTSIDPLPVETRLQRHGLWDKLLAVNGAQKDEDYVKVENPYQLAAWPSVDVNLSSSVQHAGATSSGVAGANNYSILSGGDLGYMTTNFLMTGSGPTDINTMRLTTGRSDPDGALLGGMQATNFAFGDIVSPSIDNVTNDPNGRGAVVSNRALNASTGFDTHTFVGNAVPGWEVELYQNKTLLGFQTIGNDGRYVFTDIPLLYGNNDFRIVLYGPQGQTEERTETIMVGDSMVKPGKLEYTVSANQKDMGTLDSLTTTQPLPTASTDARLVSEMRYGINKNLTAAIGLAQTTVPEAAGDNVEHRYASTNIDAAVGGAFIDLNAVRDVENGWMAGATALTSIDDVSLRMRYRQFNDFVSETENPITGQHKSDAEVDANGQFYLPIVQDYNQGWKIERETFVTESPKITYSSTFAKTFWGTSFSNTLSYIDQDSNSQTQGTAGWQTHLDGVLWRAEGLYQVMPDVQIQDAALTTQYRIDKDLTAQTKIDNQLLTEKVTTLSQSLTWNFDNCQFSLNGDIDSRLGYALGLSLSFSLAHDPAHDAWHMQRQGAANAGSIATRIFQDDNYNGLYDDGEKTVADAKPRINNLPLPDSAQDGSFISPIAAYEPVTVSVDPASLKDPMLSPGSTGYRVMTRPGDVVSLNLPVISTSAVDGVIVIQSESGSYAPLPNIVVELTGRDGKIKRVVSESEGYFIFEKVRPGDYTLSVPPEALAQYNATLTAPVTVTIGKVSDFYTGNNLLLHANAKTPEEQKQP
ncbi:MAG: hypothetical protein WCD70_01865 [Alphaproteobacteria bacterium]